VRRSCEKATRGAPSQIGQQQVGGTGLLQTTDSTAVGMTMGQGAGIPIIIRAARAFLVLCIVVWGGGAIQGWNHLSADEARETSSEVRFDARLLVERTALAVFAGVSLWATARRRPLGRWGTVALACVVAYRLLPGLAYGWRALSGQYAPPVGFIAYSSRTDVFMAVLLNTVILAALGALAVRLIVGKSAARYFRPVHLGGER
jgi:hypothetical protein